jgi:hypothetical protein
MPASRDEIGREGMVRVGEYPMLTTNYLLKRFEAFGCQAAPGLPRQPRVHSHLRQTDQGQPRHNGL